MSDPMPTAATPKLALWSEGLKSFQKRWRAWLPLGAIFFVLTMLSNIAVNHYLMPMIDQIQSYQKQGDKDALLVFAQNAAPLFSAIIFALSFVIYAQHYLFLSFFITCELPVETEKANVRQFFCFFIRGLQLTFAIILPPAFLIALFIALSMAAFVINTNLLAPILCVLILALTSYLMINFFLVMPLAAGRIAHPFRNSLILTRGNWWRIFSNFLLLMLLMGICYVLISIAIYLPLLILSFTGNGFLLKSSDAINTVFRYVFGSGFQMVAAGIMAAFSSAACRILYDEKRITDPHVILTRRI